MSQETTQPYPVVSNYSIDESEFILGIQALGSVIKAQSLGLNLDQCTSSLALASGTLRLTPVYLKNPSTITG